ncbi:MULTISPECIES: YggS family pyridoxal phosphate-dependent enzyme [unclassified Prochlorococcus]|uniref:YggS family pyridoxal phosphate-dependent enzyme n=1 Tax=unclassified Prochlorococcus TaxID=2627481 RepID=UPI0005640C88|nr:MULTISPECIES: YggS family pyridoxal phosphate-dependent enzyme [unclassified Prochlorococcus]
MNLTEFRDKLPSGVNLLAVSKGQSVSAIKWLASQGQVDFGESRVQEALPKVEMLDDLKEINWHFIGSLQANKVRQVVKNFNVIHSVDSLKLAKRISRIAGEEHKVPRVMAQIKLRQDPTKFGFSSNELLDVFEEFVQLPNINLLGVMTIAPLNLDRTERKILFRECRLLADKLKLQDCSMGMSRDWEDAVDAGATWIRLGTFLFGDRHRV